MNRVPADHDDIERLLAEHLRRQAEALNVELLLSRIRGTMAVEPEVSAKATVTPSLTLQAPRRLRLFGKILAWTGGTVAIFALAFAFLFGGRPEPLRAATPQELLQEAQKTHHLPLDRCYLVEFQREVDANEEPSPMAVASRTTRLWTRGDRFWIEGNHPRFRFAWGRDENGIIWISPGPKRGVRIDPEEAPRWLTMNCDISELRPEHLLNELLRDFDLTREAGSSPAVQVIRAELKPGRWTPALRSAVVELDTETKALRRVVLRRQPSGGRTVTTTYTLVETATQNDDRYRLEGHLVDPFEIYSTENQPQRRRDVLTLLFGPRGVDWIKPVPK